MAIPASALDRTGIGNKAREDLADIIYNIAPTETPFVSMAQRTTASQDAHEWTTDALAAARSDNKHVDGDDFIAEGASGQVGSGFVGVAITAGSRLGNHCQISRKDIVVTRRADIVKKAGRKQELGYQIAKAGKELKRDIEASVTANNAAVQGTTTVAGQSASYCAWIRTNDHRGTGGADPASLVNGFPTGTAATDGTLEALSETHLLDVIGAAYISGGNPDTLMMYPTVLQKFSAYMFSSTSRVADVQTTAKATTGATVLGAVSVYVSDFGALAVVPNRFQRSRDVLVIDSNMWALAYLTPFSTVDIAKSGDSEKKLLIADYTLECRNEASSGVIADVSASLAMVA